jgi:N-methylhydantoinase B
MNRDPQHETLATRRRIDPITFEVIKNALDSIADQAAIALFRSAYSAIVRDSLDYSTAIFDHKGRMLAQGLTTALHIGSFPDAMRHLVETYEGRIELGDIYILNDPYGSGGMHLPDVYVIKAVFYEDELVGFATTLTHMSDMGGITPGSNPVHSTEIYQEGLRIPLLKLYDRGVLNETIIKILEKNTRLPVKVLGDLRAQIAGCKTAEAAFHSLFAKYGPEMLGIYFDEIHDYSERVMREVISSLPNGDYHFTDYIDGLGENPEPIVMKVKVTVAGDTMTVDWTGTSPQVKGGINSPIPYTKAATYLAARLLVRQDIPNSEGYMRPLTTIAPLGSILNPLEPAACATRGLTGMRALDTILGALAQVVPARIPAAGGGGNYWPTIGGYQDGKPFVYVESVMGTWGGRPNRDGAEGVPHPGGNQPNQPIEMVEARQPLEVTQYRMAEDTAGPGKHRGGLALIREYRLLAAEAVLTMRGDRHNFLPWGLEGGRSGTPSCSLVNPGPNERVLPSLPMEAIQLRNNDVFRIVMAGGAGYGDPLDRDPQLALRDVLEEKLSIEHVHSEYGVVIEARSMTVDVEATEELRRTMRASEDPTRAVEQAP